MKINKLNQSKNYHDKYMTNISNDCINILTKYKYITKENDKINISLKGKIASNIGEINEIILIIPPLAPNRCLFF